MLHTMKAVCDGDVIKLENVPDEVFSSGMLGGGFAIIPKGDNFVCPVDGKVTEAHAEGHAYMLTSNDGIELLVHIGIDTVELEGRCFTSFVKKGDIVSKGEKLATVDIKKIIELGYDPVTVVIVTNDEIVSKKTIKYGKIKAGETALEYSL